MLDRSGLDQILEVVSKRWMDLAKDPENKALQSLPNDFWMNAAGGRAGMGKWVTVVMYTENEADAETFRSVLQKWQAKGNQERTEGAPDVLKMGKQ
ncbi:hypothetical protein CENSYa_0267 [Cenarchaeum symbiosum A]|uniref:Uncharacterized protein n=1 Tax=Cenarchaeum symbiosum (strain A) TaxID=414004 RepID=A0RU92_CENSY|nr:hypothetical protein CENSYa_0267 [Cenarchaeum symbiosum A]